MFIFPKTHLVVLLGERVPVLRDVEFEHLEAAVEVGQRDVDPPLEAPEKTINSEKMFRTIFLSDHLYLDACVALAAKYPFQIQKYLQKLRMRILFVKLYVLNCMGCKLLN